MNQLILSQLKFKTHLRLFPPR